jgi:hypothetical protein
VLNRVNIEKSERKGEVDERQAATSCVVKDDLILSGRALIVENAMSEMDASDGEM